MLRQAKANSKVISLGILIFSLMSVAACTPDFFPFQRGSVASARAEGEPPLALNQYVAVCEQELGTPLKPVTIPPIDCFGSHMQEIDPGTKDEDGRCHRPSALLGAYSLEENEGQDPCAKGSRIGRIDDGDVTWVTVCRKYGEHKDSQAFDDMNLIGWNRRTGKTCFFNSLVTGETTDKPIVADVPLSVYEQGSEVFMTPEQIRDVVPCAKCHSANAFLRTPHVSDLDVVPRLTRQSPYTVVHPEIVAPFLKEGESTRITDDDLPALKACTSCHAVGRAEYCKTYVPLAWGYLDPKLSYGAAQTSQPFAQSLWHRDVLPSLADPDLDAANLPSVFKRALHELDEFCKSNDSTH